MYNISEALFFDQRNFKLALAFCFAEREPERM